MNWIKYQAQWVFFLSLFSIPGFLESLDDFYQMSSNMVMLQTTNNVFNKKLYNFVKPQSLFAWQRVRVANMMANGGEEWSKIMTRYNSGTYRLFVFDYLF